MSEPNRQPRDRLIGQPQEREHSDGVSRHAGLTASGEGCRFRREEWKPDGREPQGLGSRQPGPAKPDALVSLPN